MRICPRRVRTAELQIFGIFVYPGFLGLDPGCGLACLIFSVRRVARGKTRRQKTLQAG
jgi:hypothetical protein